MRWMAIFSIFILPLACFGQEKFATLGRLNVGVGTGFGLYSISNNQLGDPSTGALSGNLQLHGDVGVFPFLTVGLHLFRNGFATDDSSSSYESARILGAGVHANLNFWRRPKTTWYLTGRTGMSGFRYENQVEKTDVRSAGVYVGAGLGFRRYFGDHVGIFSEILVVGYDYPKFKNTDDVVLKTRNLNNYQIALAGAELKFGITVALGANGK
jgi:hypothetical protein